MKTGENKKGVGKPENEDRKPLKFLLSDLNKFVKHNTIDN